MARGLQVRLPEFWTDIMDVLPVACRVSTFTELVAGPQSGQSRVLSKIRFLQVFSRLPNNISLFSHFKPSHPTRAWSGWRRGRLAVPPIISLSG